MTVADNRYNGLPLFESERGPRDAHGRPDSLSRFVLSMLYVDHRPSALRRVSGSWCNTFGQHIVLDRLKEP